MRVEVSQHEKGLRKPPKELSQEKFRNSGIGRQATLWLACQAINLFCRLYPLRHMDFGGKGIGRRRGRRRTLGFGFCCSLGTGSRRILLGFFPLGRGRRGTSAAILGERCWLRSKLRFDGTSKSSG
ncbi:hypothetical protein PoB_003238200 [Plakobranchus ocellatus]|uniref:Uncharacterized protein n=1 Tax=Plakobranchus ocellatus TaxID=259542 RepID=A0AAV4AG47_9GAST|nr:hypothetical protein PoB_003238200 [Plakobranchus ocellatus]